MSQHNATDKKQLDKKRLRENFDSKQELRDWRELLENPAFRRIVWKLLEETKIFATSFTGNSTTFYNEGMRNIGLKIQAKLIEAKPEAYPQMMIEAHKREETNNV